MKKLYIVGMVFVLLILVGCTARTARDINQAGIQRCEHEGGKWLFSGYDVENKPITLCLIDGVYAEMHGWD